MTGFESFDDYLAVPRVTDLALSPDGNRLVATVAELSTDGDRWVESLWGLAPDAKTEATRLTHSAQNDSGPAPTNNGELFFLTTRDSQENHSAIWSLPAQGEPSRVLATPGGVSDFVVARDSGTIIAATTFMPGCTDASADTKRREARKRSGVSGIMHTQSPVRFWDHDLGPEQVHLLVSAGPDAEPRDLTPSPGRSLDEATFAVTHDGRTVITSWAQFDEPGLPQAQLVSIDVESGARTVLAEGAHFGSPALSPDGQQVVCVCDRRPTREDPPAFSLWLIDLASGETRELAQDPGIWPESPQFSADGRSVFFVADELGHRPIFRLDIESDTYLRVTSSGYFTDVLVAPDGESLYALRNAMDCPPTPVKVDAQGMDAEATVLNAPGRTDATGPVERVQATAADGATVSGWLTVPDGASAENPAPLVLWVHGGPEMSWNGWSWRWNPWLLVSKGYAVLQPDPALSSGYGADWILRGWGQRAGSPFSDLMTITDAVAARPDINESKTAAMGASYGGYMANWIAGHTDRFRCIVSHASVWSLDGDLGSTDEPGYNAREYGLPADYPEWYQQWSPHHSLDSITTPMLVIHGDKDYRCPIGEALRLWWDLQRTGVESRFLYFPDEGHWIQKPGNARVWYETVWAWLAEHVHGEPWVQPELL